MISAWWLCVIGIYPHYGSNISDEYMGQASVQLIGEAVRYHRRLALPPTGPAPVEVRSDKLHALPPTGPAPVEVRSDELRTDIHTH